MLTHVSDKLVLLLWGRANHATVMELTRGARGEGGTDFPLRQDPACGATADICIGNPWAGSNYHRDTGSPIVFCISGWWYPENAFLMPNGDEPCELKMVGWRLTCPSCLVLVNNALGFEGDLHADRMVPSPASVAAD
jgi:hypothetical protein